MKNRTKTNNSKKATNKKATSKKGSGRKATNKKAPSRKAAGAKRPAGKKPSVRRAGTTGSQTSSGGAAHHIVPADPPAFLWRGFDHRWEYNHRINRVGSYVRHVDRRSGGSAVQGRVGHPAASGAGPDVARVNDHYTEIDVPAVFFQPGRQTIKITSKEGKKDQIKESIWVDLDPGLQGRDTYTVVINGFDLKAERDADKLHTFCLSLSDPTVNATGDRLHFDIRGLLNLDCDSFECDGYPTWEIALAMLRPDVGIGPMAVKLAGKFNLTTDYTLRVYYMIIAGDAEDLNVVDTDVVKNTYRWDKKTEIHRKNKGIQPVRVKGDQVWSAEDVTSTFAFRHLQMVLSREKGLLKSDDAMHLLEWDMAVKNIQAEGDEVSAELTLFYKNWSDGMRNARLPLSATAHRDAGKARLGAGLKLLQFRNAEHYSEECRSGDFEWKPRSDDQDDPDSRNEKVVMVSR